MAIGVGGEMAESPLRDGEAELRLIADQLPLPCWIAGPDGERSWVNRRWTDLTGSGSTSAWLGAVAEGDREAVRQSWASAVEAEQHFEVRCRLDDSADHERIALLRAEPIRDQSDHVVRWFGVLTELTDQLEAERRQTFMLAFSDRVRRHAEPDAMLREALAVLGRHLKTQRIGYAEADQAQDLLTVLMDWCDGLGGIVGRYPLLAFGPANIAALARGETVRIEDHLDHPLIGPADLPAYDAMGIRAAITVPLIRDGRLVALLSVHHASPRRWTDEEVRLVEEVAERTWAILERAMERTRAEAELERSREALHHSEKLTALGSLLAGVAHELNNPLAVVVANALLLEEEAEGAPHAEDARRIRLAAERCAKIVRTFLAMARQRQPERALTDVSEVVRSALDLSNYTLRSAGIEVEFDAAPDVPPIWADGDQLHHVVPNLVINAQQAMLDTPMPRRLHVRTRADPSGQVSVSVTDTGPGIPDDARRRIFEPFFTTKPQGIGTGMGLSYSLGVAEAHGGTLDLTETSSEGSTFTLMLPSGEPLRSGAPVAVAREARPRDHATALVIDDEAELAGVLARMLRGEGFDAEIATSGREAKKILHDRSFDLVVSDLRMPDLDGGALFEWLRAARPDQAERMAFATGDMLSPNSARVLAAAGRPVIEKPFTRAALRRMLNEIAGPTAA